MTATTAPDFTSSRLRSSHLSVLVVFALAGMAFASWASRIADAKAELHLSPGQLGTTLLFASAGSLIALPSSGRIAGRIGAAATVRVGLVLDVVGAVVVGLGVSVVESRWLVGGGLFVLGMGFGIWDVALNLEGATVERMIGRTTMPLYHAAFSGGTVLSALIGAVLSWAGVPVVIHLIASGVIVLLVGVWSLRAFLPRELESGAGDASDAGADGTLVPVVHRPRSAWLERRTLLIGLVVLAAAFTEGTANDWIAVAFVEGHGVPRWAGVLAFATFLGFMTIGRLLGTRMLDRHGRVPIVRITFALALVGAVFVIFGPTWLAYAGAAVWGVGASLGFPVGMSASADDPSRAAARMSVVTTIGYSAFIAGPPLLGYLGDHVGVLKALLAVGVLVLIALFVIPAVKEPERSA
jgi:MFS family permease